MPKWRVFFMTPYVEYADVEARTEEEAIAQCETPPYWDPNEGPSMFVAVPEPDEDDEDEEDEKGGEAP